MRRNLMTIALSFSFLLIARTGAGQDNIGLTVKMDGYIINLGGEILFQPCEDSIYFWEALDNRSFGIWCNQFTDRYCEAIENIGDSAVVEMLVDSTKKYHTKLTFFYCSIEIYMAFIGSNKNDFQVYNLPKYQIRYNDNLFSLKGFYVRDNLKKIIPKNIKDLRLLYNYYWDRGYTVPKWLDDYIDTITRCKK